MSELRRTRAAIEAGMCPVAGAAGPLHIGAQLYVSIGGAAVADLAFGEARRGEPLRRNHLMLWMSSVKPVAPIALLQQWERGRLDLDDAVSRHLPEFSAGGKTSVTLRHVLTHTGGFPRAAFQWSPAPWDEILAGICAAPIEEGWIPGERAAYHVASGWYVLAEVVRRLDGRDFSRYAREEILTPLGMIDSWVGMPAEAHRAYGERIAPMHSTEDEPIVHPHWAWCGSAAACTVCRPGGSAWGPARELGRLYESLLGSGPRVLAAETIAAMTARQSVGLRDEIFGTRLDRGLGVVLDSKHYGAASAWFGSRCSARAFGHAGYRSSIAFADPERGLAVALIFNGMCGDEAHAGRVAGVIEALYADLED